LSSDEGQAGNTFDPRCITHQFERRRRSPPWDSCAAADDFLNKPVNKHELLARVHSLLRLKQFTDEMDNVETVLFSLALSIEAKDHYTEGHCDRLSKYSVALGKKFRVVREPARCSAPGRPGA